MKTEVVTITPAMAEKWLKRTTFKNRNVSPAAVTRYVDDIAKGKWMLNGESIVLDDNGNVIDGQHRLHAVIKAKTPIQSVVVQGVDPATFSTLDIGKRRGQGDVLSIAGYQNANILAAGLRLIHAYRSGRSLNNARGSGSYSRTRTEVLDLVKEHPRAIESAAYVKSASRNSELARPTAFAIMVHYEFTCENDLVSKEFFRAAFDGIPRFGEKCPTLGLRRKYGNIESKRAMDASFALRMETWLSFWDQFKTRYEREQRKPVSSPRFIDTSVDTSPYSDTLGLSI